MKKIILIPALVGVLGVGAAIGSTTLLTGNAQEKRVLSMQEIEKKALKIVNGTVTDIEFDQDQYRSVYEVEVYTDTEEFDLKFDAYTGELLKQKKERRDKDDVYDKKTASTTTTKITKEQAIEKALTKAKGTVTKVKLDDVIYEIEIRNGQHEYEVEVDSSTGEILDFEQDIED
ncbi:PepSY domain-containing protein [Lysinibacillus sp. G4S2]|uniref:PepSY domain-containing protein n=1 Tax=Lysinibacillus sp. G4S2 TaxID=3055859 RepID=UPI0025A18F2F|nr:PepSY domain-containing protein [Lysinibacillus sp. G4S2]MDM5245996.1 PepSY domain-containing protein [Lysinibacillus sp. G4S2]